MNQRQQNTIHLVLSGGFGAMLFIVNFLLGATLTYLFGIPGLSGLITGLTSGFVIAIAASSSPRFSTVSIAFTLYCVLAIPTVLMGPPGVYKVVVGLFAGLAYDSLSTLFRNRKTAHYIGWVAYTSVILALTYFAYVWLKLPEIQKFQRLVFFLFFAFLIEGFVGTHLGHLFFRRHLQKNRIVQQLQ